MSMKGIQIRKGKNGEISYRVQSRPKGCPNTTATFKRLTDAKRWKQEEDCRKREGRYFKTTASRKHTLQETICRYERDVLPNKPNAKQEQQLRWWKEQLGSYTLAGITTSLIVEYKNKLSQTITRYKRKMAPATVRRYLAALSHVLSTAAKEWEWIEESPIIDCDKFYASLRSDTAPGPKGCRSLFGAMQRDLKILKESIEKNKE